MLAPGVEPRKICPGIPSRPFLAVRMAMTETSLNSGTPGPRIVVIGNGLVAQHLVRALTASNPELAVTSVGDEPAFDRTLLPHLLDGSRIADEIFLPQHGAFIRGRVTALDRDARQVNVLLQSGETQLLNYDSLVIATGAEPVRPQIPGSERAHNLNSLKDAEPILQTTPRSVAILGAGVLGIEAAYALAKRGISTTVIHRGPRIMERQLDVSSAAVLQAALEAAGIAFRLNAATLAITADGIDLDTGQVAAESVLFCVGTSARDQLAHSAGLATDSGIIVDDAMRTSDPRILAIGDCARQRGVRSGLLSQGYAQAAVAVATLTGAPPTALAFIATTKPKISPNIFSAGDTSGTRSTSHRTADGFRRLWRDDQGCLVGAVVFGSWPSIAKLIETIRRRTPVPAWRWLAFAVTGELWPLTRDDPTHWSADTIVCQCRGITRGMVATELLEFQRLVADMRAFEQEGTPDDAPTAGHVDEGDANLNIRVLSLLTGAGQSCGDCQRLLAPLLGQKMAAVPHARPLGALAVAAAALVLLVVCFSIPYPPSFTAGWDILWRSALIEQISGYALLAAILFLGFLSLRKRALQTLLASYETWRLWHTIAALIALLILIVHTGARFGSGVAWLLTASFVATSLVGGLYSWQIANEHRFANVNLRGLLNWLHLAVMWPLPVLLAYHIAQVYLW